MTIGLKTSETSVLESRWDGEAQEAMSVAVRDGTASPEQSGSVGAGSDDGLVLFEGTGLDLSASGSTLTVPTPEPAASESGEPGGVSVSFTAADR